MILSLFLINYLSNAISNLIDLNYSKCITHLWFWLVKKARMTYVHSKASPWTAPATCHSWATRCRSNYTWTHRIQRAYSPAGSWSSSPSQSNSSRCSSFEHRPAASRYHTNSPRPYSHGCAGNSGASASSEYQSVT